MSNDRTGVFQSRRDFQETLDATKCFWAVVAAYRTIFETPPLVAISHDPQFPNRKLSAEMIEFTVDCDNKVNTVLGDAAFEVWGRIVRGETETADRELVRRAGAVFRRFHLLPHEYFRHVKRGRQHR